ncbi:hypothetical protein ACI3KS_05425 [Microbacterium sp. ZW T5_45]|uniref:hypothetical protein n=1 Tax=Microbacterium sp. ZW T5_45 TaxID=3378080 RepID=UPI0038532004
MTLSTSSRLRSLVLASSLLLTGGMLLAGCAAANADPEPTSTEQSTTDAAQTPRTPSGVSGLIASAEDGLLQVQSSDAQTAVRYTDETTVTKSVTIDTSTITVGSCVTAITDEDGTTARSITVTDAADDGTCSLGGGGGFPGGDSAGMPTDGERPEAMPTDMPSGAPDGSADAEGFPGGEGGGFGGFTSGTVTAVADGVLTVESTGFGDDAETTTTDITVTADTTATGTVAATTADIATGLCVTAAGEADDAGGYDATSLSLSDADENGECSTGFGGFPGGGAPGVMDQGGDE